MATQLARRMEQMKASEIREILKLTAKPEVISFAGGLPAAELMPVEEMVAVCREALEQDGRRALQYSTTEGHPGLRAAIAARMNRQAGSRLEAEHVLITTGSQQGLDLTGKLFLDEGDVVLCESPTYLGAINAFRVYGPTFVEVPTDDDGMILPELERLLQQHARIKFIYVVPDFQNPSGRTWSLRRRRAFMDLVSYYEVPVIEDRPYSELYFEGEPLSSLQSLDRSGLVISLGTFSKILCPGLRVAWLVATPELLRRYVLVKQSTDLHTATLAQEQVHLYLARYELEGRLETMRAVYRERRDGMLAAIERAFPPGVRYTRPGGGLFLWVELPERLCARALLQRALARDVAFVPGGSFFPNGGHENTLRLSFSTMTPDRIATGIERLGETLLDALTEPAAS